MYISAEALSYTSTDGFYRLMECDAV